jgi:hypothetical protein
MSERAFEEALRATLRAAAPLEVPRRVEDRARAIPNTAGARSRWRPRAERVRFSSALGAVLVTAVLVGAIVLVASRAAPGIGGRGTPNPVTIETPFGSLVASDLELIVDGRAFRVPSSIAEPGVQTLAFTGSSTYGQLTLAWRDGNSPLALIIHFAADARTWWVSEVVATDGRAEEAGWVYFEGPLFEQPLSSAYAGRAVLSSVRSTYGETASLRFDDLSLRAFSSTTPRNPATGTMPPSGIVGTSGPDFIPMLGGDQIVGYVSVHWRDVVASNSFRSQGPDQPVFGADLKTLVGYSVPGRGFEPLSSTTTSPAIPANPGAARSLQP